ncbi:MAG: alpha/beta hydrolase [Polyangiaceae bacterium]
MKTWAGSIRAATGALALVAGLATSGCLEFYAAPLEAPKDATFVDVAGTHVHYVQAGDHGSTVVLIHGFASSTGVWATVMPALSRDHRVIAIDLKGFGLTSRPEGDYSPDAQAQLVLGVLDKLGVDSSERVALVAHSWGSSVALALTLRAPERVARVALYDAWIYEDQLPNAFLWARAGGVGEAMIGMFYDERSDEKMAGAFYDQRYVTEALVETVEEQLARPGTKAAALAAIRGQHFEAQEAKYKTIEQPVLLLWGREDRVTTLEYGERLSKELADARLVVYPQCGHFPMIEAVRPSTRELVRFLAEPDVAPAQVKPAEPKEDPKPEVVE